MGEHPEADDEQAQRNEGTVRAEERDERRPEQGPQRQAGEVDALLDRQHLGQRRVLGAALEQRPGRHQDQGHADAHEHQHHEDRHERAEQRHGCLGQAQEQRPREHHGARCRRRARPTDPRPPSATPEAERPRDQPGGRLGVVQHLVVEGDRERLVRADDHRAAGHEQQHGEGSTGAAQHADARQGRPDLRDRVTVGHGGHGRVQSAGEPDGDDAQRGAPQQHAHAPNSSVTTPPGRTRRRSRRRP